MSSLAAESLQPFVHKSEGLLRIDLYLKGVKCGHCVHKISKEIEGLSDLSQFEFEAGGHRLSLWSQQPQVFSETMNRIGSLGFEAVPMSDFDDQRQARRAYKSDLKKMAVAAVCAGNIMLFSTAVYLGAEAEFVRFFHKLSFFLVLPPLLYSAQSIWYGFWQSVRSFRFNLDLPIGIALLFGFALSTFSLFHDQKTIYFDSLAVVVYLVLTSRFVLKRYVANIQMSHWVQIIPGAIQARVLHSKGEKIKALNEVLKGETVKVLRGEVLPVDGELLSEQGILDEAVLTGEASPVVRERGDKVWAGSRLCGQEVLVETLEIGERTRVGRYISKSQDNQRKAEEDSYRWVGYFTGFVVLVSVFTFGISFFWLGLEAAYQRAFAIILVACPCAISFGIPLIKSLSGHLALNNGLVLKDTSVLKRIGQIKDVFLDKTGTLTEPVAGVVEDDFLSFTNEEREKILSLELCIDHPISNGFKKLKSNEMKAWSVTEFKYHPGQGLSGTIAGEEWAIENNLLSENKSLVVRKNNQTLGTIGIETTYKDNIVEFFTRMVDQGYRLSILSGDREDQVRPLFLSIPEAGRGDVLWAATPESKEQFVRRQFSQSLMVGDGVNDIAAMQAASISLCMPGALENNLSVADATLSRGDLFSIFNVFRLAKKITRTEQRLLGFTFTYNLFCVAAAATGWITPVVAAIIMPVSSMIVLSIVSLSLRRL